MKYRAVIGVVNIDSELPDDVVNIFPFSTQLPELVDISEALTLNVFTYCQVDPLQHALDEPLRGCILIPATVVGDPASIFIHWDVSLVLAAHALPESIIDDA